MTQSRNRLKENYCGNCMSNSAHKLFDYTMVENYSPSVKWYRNSPQKATTFASIQPAKEVIMNPLNYRAQPFYGRFASNSYTGQASSPSMYNALKILKLGDGYFPANTRLAIEDPDNPLTFIGSRGGCL